jgi:hypothetical protein
MNGNMDITTFLGPLSPQLGPERFLSRHGVWRGWWGDDDLCLGGFGRRDCMVGGSSGLHCVPRYLGR